ncbi:MAG: NERD domain-containing serine/threonine-protein kinase [Deltaproteobacteria bacterium]|nr:NERD domain-containing serine/threonine-protein kinase [Deltaproteobacteria bacterium]
MNKSGVRHIPCGPFSNESERVACSKLKSRIQKLGNDNTWIFLTNIPFSYQANRLSDEIDLIVLGPPGITIVEIKHWDKSYLKSDQLVAEAEAEKLNSKVKRLSSRLKKKFPIDFLVGKFLLTKEYSSLKESTVPTIFRGTSFFSLSDWQDLLSINETQQFTGNQLEEICKFIEPNSRIALTGDLRKFGNLIKDLERTSPKEEQFHRIYKGENGYRREKVILHLYDLSASSEKKSFEKARREYETLQKFQKSPYLPGLLDSFQDAPDYPGEFYYYSIIDPLAPSIDTLSKDHSWTHEQRLVAAREICLALNDLHNPKEVEQDGLIHRNINPNNVKYRINTEKPIFTELQFVKISSFESISDSSLEFDSYDEYVAPEIKASGRGIADSRSDIYSLCASLSVLFKGDDPRDQQALDLLSRGLDDKPDRRITLVELYKGFDNLISKTSPTESSSHENLSPEYWHDEYISRFDKKREYKILSRLGSGGIGQTFKVLEVNLEKNAEYGVYVAKVINAKENASNYLEAYRTVKSYSVHPNLAVIHEVIDEWKPNEISALMQWIDGIPLWDLMGVFELHAEDVQEESIESLCLRWIVQICQALGALHRVDLVHGDVSPKNIIVSGIKVTLTDYDGITKKGSKPRINSPMYSSPRVQMGSDI